MSTRKKEATRKAAQEAHTVITQPSVITATGGAGAPPAINPLLKVKMASVMDQASDGEVQLLPASRLAAMRRHYIAVVGGEPLPSQRIRRPSAHKWEEFWRLLQHTVQCEISM